MKKVEKWLKMCHSRLIRVEMFESYTNLILKIWTVLQKLGSNPCPIGLYNSNAKQINACINILISLFYVCKYNIFIFLIIMNPRSSDRHFD